MSSFYTTFKRGFCIICYTYFCPYNVKRHIGGAVLGKNGKVNFPRRAACSNTSIIFQN
nr:MAG TPA: hypothetical protein [Caudoviricetes sp.]